MTIFARISVLAILALAGLPTAAPAAAPEVLGPIGASFPLCRAPVTKSYPIQPGFCATQLVAMIPQGVPYDGCGECCGPFGIPPIYASGNNVMVRQTPEMQERVAQFLIDLGAYKPAKLAHD